MTGEKFEELWRIMKKLRNECPWDREQTHDSIKAATLEESYELIETIDEKNYKELKGELGDLLLHILFHSVIAEEENNFSINEVIDGISAKLIRRHPHIFAETKVKDNDEIMRNWEEIKLGEGRDSVLEGVPKAMPGLARAFRLQEKASKVGFDWDNVDNVWEKVVEELNELKKVANENNKEEMEKEFGDLFFALTNYARFLGINPENSIRYTNEKFINRFTYVEEKIKETGKKITESSLPEMDKYWEESKKQFK